MSKTRSYAQILIGSRFIWFILWLLCSPKEWRETSFIIQTECWLLTNGKHGMEPFEPCLSGKRSWSYLLLEVWFESWCGTPLEKKEVSSLFIYDNWGDALYSFPIHEGNFHSSNLSSELGYDLSSLMRFLVCKKSNLSLSIQDRVPLAVQWVVLRHQSRQSSHR